MCYFADFFHQSTVLSNELGRSFRFNEKIRCVNGARNTSVRFCRVYLEMKTIEVKNTFQELGRIAVRFLAVDFVP